MFPLNLQTNQIFSISDPREFDKVALEIFRFQASQNKVYALFLQQLNIKPDVISRTTDIPFLPIEFFKSHKIISGNSPIEVIFTSSGTTGQPSYHHVSDITIYKKSLKKNFYINYKNPHDYCILALLPSYLERSGSSLIFMADTLIKQSQHPNSGFFLDNFAKLSAILKQNEQNEQKTILLGVSYALLQFSEQNPMQLKHTIVMETGGMKGRHKEITKEELHNILKERFQTDFIHSEYGMTELLSQAYAKVNGKFFCPPWMQVMIRDTNDPFSFVEAGKTGGLNIIDLANINSCSFIETKDLGRINKDASFEVLGRFENSDIRGCNLLVAE